MALLNFFSRKSRPLSSRLSLHLYNTRGKELQEFTLPVRVKEVRMYNCGPTVYGTQHIGNLAMFVFTDVLRRTLEYNGFPVKQIINITDFGHLTSDADEGEDKMTKGLKREGLPITMENMTQLAEKYTQIFLDDLRALNIDTSHIEFPRASAYIKAEIAMVQTLIEKGYAYEGADGVYYDTARFPAYGELGGIDREGQMEGARVAINSEKHNPTDFVLWKKDPNIGWDSPWGKGFPGWHIECSAMINSCLGKQIDIHTGGIEHIAIHHNNEIAQSEAATGKHPLSRFWMHRAHIQIEGSKIAKSEGNVAYLSEIIERGFHPLALRYLFLGAHYRAPSNFSWEALEATQNALARLLAVRLSIQDSPGEIPKKYQKRFHERINDDLDTPGALAALWEMVKDEALAPADLLAGLIDFDRVLGIGLTKPDEKLTELGHSELKIEIPVDEVPEEVRTLITERETARASRDFHTSDAIRQRILDLGYTLDDTAQGTRIFKKQ